MTRYADPHRCPDCRAALPAVPARTACTACGLPLEGPTATELFATLLRADALIATLRASSSPGQPALAAYPSYPAPSRAAASGPAPGRPAAAKPPVRWTVPGVLLALGGLCLVVGALVFLAVTWSVLGVGGRTAVLVALTGVAATGAYLSARRDLRGAAETFATVTGLFLTLDLAGAASAGWFGGLSGESTLLTGALTVLVALAAGNVSVRRLPTGPLVSAQVIAAAAALVSAVAAIARFEHHSTTATALSAVAALSLGEGARRTDQPVLAWSARGTAFALWAVLVLTGLAQAAEAWDNDGRGAATWTDVQPLLTAAGLAAAYVVVARLRDLGPAVVRQGAVVLACWLTAVAVAAVLGDTATELVLVAVGAAVAACAATAVLRSMTTELGVAALGLAGAALLGSLSAVGLLVDAVASEVATQVGRSLDSLSPDLLARAELDPAAPGVAAPWTLPLALLAVALAGAVLAHERLGRPGTGTLSIGIAVAVPVAAVTALPYAPVLLVVVVVASLLAAGHVVAAVRGLAAWDPGVDGLLATAWAVVAGSVAVYHPAPAVAVALVTAVVVATYAVRTGAAAALAATPLLAAASTGAVCWLTDVSVTWTIAAVIVVVAAVTTLVGLVRRGRDGSADARTAMYVVALATALVPVVAWVGESTAATPTWLAAYLTLAAAGAAAVAIAERSREAAWVAAGLELGATWVRLHAAGVETPEAYTLPLAAALLAFGGWTLWRDPRVGTMRTLGPGIATALVPSLLLVATDPIGPRAVVLAGACAALLAIGAVRGLRAPLVGGAVGGASLVVIELAPYHDAVPRWVLLAVAGTCLVVAGVRWEHLAGAGRRGWGRLVELR